MIHGIGTDIIEVRRIKKTLLGDHGFRERVFSPEEIRYCEDAKRGVRYERFAARFAAKEAFLKACGTGLREGFNLSEITVIHNEMKQPRIHLTGKSKETFDAKIQGIIHLSLSHLSGMAQAVALIERK
jgi:holo-[acyl-carrier protein] synthase